MRDYRIIIPDGLPELEAQVAAKIQGPYRTLAEARRKVKAFYELFGASLMVVNVTAHVQRRILA